MVTPKYHTIHHSGLVQVPEMHSPWALQREARTQGACFIIRDTRTHCATVFAFLTKRVFEYWNPHFVVILGGDNSPAFSRKERQSL